VAVTRTLAQLAADLRLGDGDATPTGPLLVILQRVDATARTVVTRFAPDAPDAIHNEAYVRLSAWLYDADPTGASPGGPKGLLASGAGALLAPYRVQRGTLVEGVPSDASTAAGLSASQVRELVYSWAQEGNTERIPLDKVRNAGGLIAIWARDGDASAIPANKLANAPGGTGSTHYLGAWSALTSQQRGAIQIGQVVLRYNKFWIAADEAQARLHGPLDVLADGWRCLNDQMRGVAHSSARQYDVGDLVLATAASGVPSTDDFDVFLCLQASNYSQAQIIANADGTRSHFMRLSGGDAGGGNGGLSSVASDGTLTGDGTSGTPLAVARPYPLADETKLASVESGATQDQTATEIRDLLASLLGNQRLSADAIRDLPESGGGDTSPAPVEIFRFATTPVSTISLSDLHKSHFFDNLDNYSFYLFEYSPPADHTTSGNSTSAIMPTSFFQRLPEGNAWSTWNYHAAWALSSELTYFRVRHVRSTGVVAVTSGTPFSDGYQVIVSGVP